MNETFRLSVLICYCFVIIFFSCRNTVNNDAARLAEVHNRRINTVHLMLQTHDTILINKYLDTLQFLDAEFNIMKGKFAKKYTDSVAYKQFESAFIEALNN